MRKRSDGFCKRNCTHRRAGTGIPAGISTSATSSSSSSSSGQRASGQAAPSPPLYMCTTTPSLFIVGLSPSGSCCHLSCGLQESGWSKVHPGEDEGLAEVERPTVVRDFAGTSFQAATFVSIVRPRRCDPRLVATTFPGTSPGSSGSNRVGGHGLDNIVSVVAEDELGVRLDGFRAGVGRNAELISRTRILFSTWLSPLSLPPLHFSRSLSFLGPLFVFHFCVAHLKTIFNWAYCRRRGRRSRRLVPRGEAASGMRAA